MRREFVLLGILITFVACSNSSNVSFVEPTNASASCGAAAPNVVYLSPSDVSNPDGRAAVKAAAAYLQHSVIVVCGGQLDQLAQVLHLDDPGSVSATEAMQVGREKTIPVKAPSTPTPPPYRSPPPIPTAEPVTPIALNAVAYHLSSAGVVETFDSFVEDSDDKKDALNSWISTVTSPHEEPSIGSWHQVFTETLAWGDERWGVLQLIYNYWRLNNFNTKLDWYMESERELGTPGWNRCVFDVFFKQDGYIGVFNGPRMIKMSPEGNDIVLYDHAPRTTESTGTATFSIGASLGKAAGGVNAEYSQSWSQPDVTIRDGTRAPTSEQTVLFTNPDLSTTTASPRGCPPETSRTTFFTPHASIFQVPQGGSFKASSYTNFHFTEWRVKGELFQYKVGSGTGEFALSPAYTFLPSVFDVSPKTVIHLSKKHREATIHVSARSGDSNLGWHITNVPHWIALSQGHGLGNKDVTVEVQASASFGSVANLNLDTEPKGGANSVETGPLIVRVEFAR